VLWMILPVETAQPRRQTKFKQVRHAI
jgi:hypothetical protein